MQVDLKIFLSFFYELVNKIHATPNNSVPFLLRKHLLFETESISKQTRGQIKDSLYY